MFAPSLYGFFRERDENAVGDDDDRSDDQPILNLIENTWSMVHFSTSIMGLASFLHFAAPNISEAE